MSPQPSKSESDLKDSICRFINQNDTDLKSEFCNGLRDSFQEYYEFLEHVTYFNELIDQEKIIKHMDEICKFLLLKDFVFDVSKESKLFKSLVKNIFKNSVQSQAIFFMLVFADKDSKKVEVTKDIIESEVAKKLTEIIGESYILKPTKYNGKIESFISKWKKEINAISQNSSLPELINSKKIDNAGRITDIYEINFVDNVFNDIVKKLVKGDQKKGGPTNFFNRKAVFYNLVLTSGCFEGNQNKYLEKYSKSKFKPEKKIYHDIKDGDYVYIAYFFTYTIFDPSVQKEKYNIEGLYRLKIGLTNGSRFIDKLDVAYFPEELKIALVIYSSKAIDLEDYIHDYLKQNNRQVITHGKEWFFSNPTEIEKIYFEFVNQ